MAVATATAQRAPITITPVLSSPHPTSLEAMAERGSTSLMANIIVNDLATGELPVRLHFKFQQGNKTIESIPNPVVTPMFLGAGEARTLFGADFAQYLRLDNLSFRGMSKEQYLRNGRLGDGLWKISIWAEHVHTGFVISNVGTTVAWLSQCPPPELLAPREGVETPQHESEPLIFSWKPSKFTGGSAVMYRFDLWEIRDQSRAPQAITESQPVFYTAETAGTMVTLPAGSVAMQPGLRYCWRVTAFDPVGKLTFEKKGQSDVRTFKYLSECPPVENLNVNVIDYGREVNFNWGFNEQHVKYNIELYSDDREFVINDTKLENDISLYHKFSDPGKWHISVQGVCANGRTAKTSPTADFEIPEKPVHTYDDCPECVCDDPPAPRPITNRTLMPLAPGDVIENRTGRTTFEIISATQEDDGESFRGLMYMNMPIWHCRFLLEYDHLMVNTDHMIISGHYASVEMPLTLSSTSVDDVKAFVNELATDIAGATYNNRIRNGYSTQTRIMSVYRDGDEYLVFDGETFVNATNALAGLSRDLVVDPDGRQIVMDANGDPMTRDEYDLTGGEPLNIARRNTERDASAADNAGGHKLTQVVFSRSKEELYGFDAYDGSQPKGLYPTINDESQYRPAYVCMPPAATDMVHIDAPQSVVFRTDCGIELGVNAQTLDLRLNSPSQPREAATYAYDPEGNIVGKLNVLTFDEKEIRVHLVSVNGAGMSENGTSKLDIKKLQEDVNNIFRQAVVKVTMDEIEQVNITFANGKSFTHGGKGTLRNYNQDQKAAIQALPKSADPNDYYLFLVECYDRFDTEGQKTNEVVSGYMPVGRHYGFIYNQYDNARTIAHEIAHGALALSHTFADGSESYLGPQGTTPNLMDYNGGTHLNHIQWQWAHETHRNIQGFLDEESEGEAWNLEGTKYLCINDEEAINAIRQYRYFYLPDGQIVDLEKYTPSGFYTEDDVTLEARGALYSIRINGYDQVTIFKTDDANKTHTVIGWGYPINSKKGMKVLDLGEVLITNPSADIHPVRVYISEKSIRIEQNDVVVETIPIDIDCDCTVKQNTSECDALLEKVRAKFSEKGLDNMDNPVWRAILEDPCILDGPMIHMAEVPPTETEWKKQFDLAFGTLANLAFAPIEIEIVVAMLGEAGGTELVKFVLKQIYKRYGIEVTERLLKEKAIDFARGVIVEAVFQWIYWESQDQNIHRHMKDFFSDINPKKINIFSTNTNYAKEFWENIIKAGLLNMISGKYSKYASCIGNINFSKWIANFTDLYLSDNDKWHDYVVYGAFISIDCILGSTFNKIGNNLKRPLLKDIEGTNIETGVDIFNQLWSDGLESAWDEWEDYIKDIIRGNEEENNNGSDNKNIQNDIAP